MFLRSFPRFGAIALVAGLTAAAPVLAETVKAGDLEITNAWARATPPGAPTGGAYLTVTNRGDAADTLTATTSPVAGMAMLHQMEMDNGVMKMRAVGGGVVIDPGKSVTLAPGGLHIMLMSLKQPLKAGGTVPVTLTFARAGAVTVTMPILPVGSRGPAAAIPAGTDAMSGMDTTKPMGN